MDLMETYKFKLKVLEETRKREEEAEARLLEENIDNFIHELEKKLSIGDVNVAEGYENPTISLTVSSISPQFELVESAGRESEIVERLEKDDFGPIESIELSYDPDEDKCSMEKHISVIIHLIDYSKSEKSI